MQTIDPKRCITKAEHIESVVPKHGKNLFGKLSHFGDHTFHENLDIALGRIGSGSLYILP